MEFLKNNPKWIRQPKQVQISEDKIVILTERGTDLWARTYYGFQNDNAPVFQVETTDKYFSFIVKTEFESTCRFDQCGVAMYLNSDNWFKASIEYENEKIQRLGSVVTNHGYSDWATTDISSDIKSMWYRFSRRDSDYCIECSEDGINFRQMRIFHMWEGAEKITYVTAVELWLLKRMEPVYAHYPWKLLLKSGTEGVATSDYGRNLMREMMLVYDGDQKRYAQIAGHGFRILAEAMEKNLPYELKCPSLLICGTQDHAGSCIRYNKAWHQKSKIPLKWIEGAGHNSNTDKPELINSLIEEFAAGI